MSFLFWQSSVRVLEHPGFIMRLVLEGDTVKFEPDFKDFEVSINILPIWLSRVMVLLIHEKSQLKKSLQLSKYLSFNFLSTKAAWNYFTSKRYKALTNETKTNKPIHAQTNKQQYYCKWCTFLMTSMCIISCITSIETVNTWTWKCTWLY